MDTKDIRQSMIDEAIKLEKGSWPEYRKFHKYYEYEDYEIGLYIPGKEAPEFKILKSKDKKNKSRLLGEYEWPNDEFINYDSKNKVFPKKGQIVYKMKKTAREINKINREDCAPIVKFKGKRISGHEIPESFKNIIFEICESVSTEEARLITRELMKMSNLEHHFQIENFFRYQPKLDRELMNIQIKSKNLNIPIIVYFYYLELIALNEDIKYHSGNFEKDSRAPWEDLKVGRINNLRTLIFVIGILKIDTYKKEKEEDILEDFLKKTVHSISDEEYTKYFSF